MFSAFSKKIGIKSYREYEEQHIKRAEELSQQKSDLANRAGRLSNQIEFEESVDWLPRLSALEDKLGNLQEGCSGLVIREKELKQRQEQVQTHYLLVIAGLCKWHYFEGRDAIYLDSRRTRSRQGECCRFQEFGRLNFRGCQYLTKYLPKRACKKNCLAARIGQEDSCNERPKSEEQRSYKGSSPW